MRTSTRGWMLASALVLSACATKRGVVVEESPSVSALRLIGEQRLAPALDYQGSTVGGLSSLDYDAASDTWYLISDDRSDRQPARVYTARLAYDDQAVQPVRLTGVVTLRQPDGTPYPSGAVDPQKTPDPEGLRYEASTQSLWWTSEGDRAQGVDPFIRQVRTDGAHMGELPLPALFKMSTSELGPRNNGVFEGMSFTPDGQSLWVSLEEPLYQDGPRADVTETRSPVRLTHFNRASGQVEAQVAYMLDKVAAVPNPPSAFKVNGVVEVLALDARRLLVLERSFSVGVGNTVRLYEADLSRATDVKDVAALANATYTPVAKRLVLDLGTLGLPVIDNVEGLAWGSRLPNGHRSLVLVSDDNFSQAQVMQVLVFDVVP